MIIDVDFEFEVDQAEVTRVPDSFGEQRTCETATLPGRIDAKITKKSNLPGRIHVISR